MKPYWWTGVESATSNVADLPRRADVLVVGSGLTGSVAARDLAAGGREVVVLDRIGLGAGASSRNGGSMHPGVKQSLSKLLKDRTGAGRAIYQESVRAFEFAESFITEEAINCDYVRAGHLELAHRHSHAEAMRARARLYEELRLPVTYIDEAGLDDEIGSQSFLGGLLFALSGTLHPGKLARGAVQAAQRAGALMSGNIEVTGIKQRGSRFTVTTTRGPVDAGDVLVATDGYTGAFAPKLRRRIVPIDSFMIATEPLDPGTAAEVSPRGRSFLNSKNLLFYWRVLPDNRLVFGGRTTLRPMKVAVAREKLYHGMLSIHPQLAGIELSHAWGGKVGFTLDLIPHVGRSNGIAYALGYCGSGVALSGFLGARAAAMMMQNGSTVFQDMRFSPIPAYNGRPWFLPAVGAYYQLMDRVG